MTFSGGLQKLMLIWFQIISLNNNEFGKWLRIFSQIQFMVAKSLNFTEKGIQLYQSGIHSTVLHITSIFCVSLLCPMSLLSVCNSYRVDTILFFRRWKCDIVMCFSTFNLNVFFLNLMQSIPTIVTHSLSICNRDKRKRHGVHLHLNRYLKYQSERASWVKMRYNIQSLSM